MLFKVVGLFISTCFFYRDSRNKAAVSGKLRGVESYRKGTRESRAQPEPDANAELQVSLQVFFYYYCMSIQTYVSRVLKTSLLHTLLL